jgi:putative SOS response-associated peptidase YedK
VYSFTILTTDASPDVRPVHDRMPVILEREDWAAWLDRSSDPEILTPLLRPIFAGCLKLHEVATWVNKPDHDDPSCIEPVDRDA